MKKCFLICALLFVLTGCSEWAVRPGPGAIVPPLIQPTLVDALVETVTALTIANTVSTPVNPYATPISIGLAGIVAMLEALRRKEKAARKHAENSNNVSDKT
ncbi:unnamed protein product [marine sediment metagenome]|uniref:Uncharacterized protein n=1 Tax=marine sediment metagenome TaxID=412755 RepID=X1MBL2_9ZZZZ